MNFYKYWLLKHIDLIDDIKGIITYYAKIRIIRPPPVEVFEYDDNTYIHDNIMYHINKSNIYEPVYNYTLFTVKNNQIVSIYFYYYTFTGEVYSIMANLSNTNRISLYPLNNMLRKNSTIDGTYTSTENVIFVVE
jgi:hypothetical protein